MNGASHAKRERILGAAVVGATPTFFWCCMSFSPAAPLRRAETDAADSFGASPNEITPLEGMPSSTVCLQDIPCGVSTSPKNVLSHRDSLKMGWAHTCPVPAQVINREIRRDRPVHFLVGEAVDVDSSTVVVEVPVPSTVFLPSPDPARLGLLNEAPESD
jgi:hypothetical protein